MQLALTQALKVHKVSQGSNCHCNAVQCKCNVKKHREEYYFLLHL